MLTLLILRLCKQNKKFEQKSRVCDALGNAFPCRYVKLFGVYRQVMHTVYTQTLPDAIVTTITHYYENQSTKRQVSLASQW